MTSIDEIDGPVAPPDPHIVSGDGEPRPAATPRELRAVGDYYYRANELARAREFYEACSFAAEGELRAACLWATGATLVAEARKQALDDVRIAHDVDLRLGLGPRPPSPRGCDPPSYGIALLLLRVAQRSDSTSRRALVIAALYEELDEDAEALKFYAQAHTLDPEDPTPARAIDRLRARQPHPPPECRPRDCPALPFGWHRQTGELAVRGSAIDGSSRERVFACFGVPGELSNDTWIYRGGSCTRTLDRGGATTSQRVSITVRIHFAGDVVDRVTHERAIEDRECGLSTR